MTNQYQSGIPTKKKSDLLTLFKAATTGDLDLSNRSLSDMHAIDLCKCLKTAGSHIRLLSLAKNRLTDDGVA